MPHSSLSGARLQFVHNGAPAGAAGLYRAMFAFVLAFTLIAAFVLAWNLLVAAGWPAAFALLAGVLAFGADPTDPLRAATMATGAFIALSVLRRA